MMKKEVSSIDVLMLFYCNFVKRVVFYIYSYVLFSEQLAIRKHEEIFLRVGVFLCKGFFLLLDEVLFYNVL